MILLCGIPSEPPLAMVRQQLEKQQVTFLMLNQRQVADIDIDMEVTAGKVTGCLYVGQRHYRLDDITAVYSRVMDWRFLPEVEAEPPESPRRFHAQLVHDILMQWCELAPARVVNRLGPMGSNSSKPYQAQLILRHGFRVPETLITNDPALALDFLERHQSAVYKSISGTRSIVQRFDDSDRERLEDIRWCPVQFQEYVEGQDVRVHTVGNEVFATAVESEASDYRYAGLLEGHPAELTAIDLPADLAKRAYQLAESLGLLFAGIDLRITGDGIPYCFEVNPCPAFSYYELNTGQPIAEALARYLTVLP